MGTEQRGHRGAQRAALIADADDVELVRTLFREYADSLGVDLSFQGFAEELAALPSGYDALLVVRRDGEPVGCAGVRPFDRGECECTADAETAAGRAHVEALHLASVSLLRAHADAADDLFADWCDQQEVVAAGQRGELSLGVDEPAVRPEPAEVLAEELAKRVGVGRARVGDQRSARSASTSSAFGSQAPAATFARTCSGLVAPAITQLTAGIASRPPTAASSSEIPRSSA